MLTRAKKHILHNLSLPETSCVTWAKCLICHQKVWKVLIKSCHLEEVEWFKIFRIIKIAYADNSEMFLMTVRENILLSLIHEDVNSVIYTTHNFLEIIWTSLNSFLILEEFEQVFYPLRYCITSWFRFLSTEDIPSYVEYLHMHWERY